MPSFTVGDFGFGVNFYVKYFGVTRHAKICFCGMQMQITKQAPESLVLISGQLLVSEHQNQPVPKCEPNIFDRIRGS